MDSQSSDDFSDDFNDEILLTDLLHNQVKPAQPKDTNRIDTSPAHHKQSILRYVLWRFYLIIYFKCNFFFEKKECDGSALFTLYFLLSKQIYIFHLGVNGFLHERNQSLPPDRRLV